MEDFRPARRKNHRQEFSLIPLLKSRGKLWLLSGLFVICSVFAGASNARFFQDGARTTAIVRIKTAGKLAQLSSWPGINTVEPVFAFSDDPSLSLVYRITASKGPAVLAALKKIGWVDYAEEDGPVKTSEILVSDPYFTTSSTDTDKEWWLNKIMAPQAWETNRGSKNVTVAVVDTGVNGKHEDLDDGRVGPGYISYCQVENSANGQCMVHIDGPVAAGLNSDDNGHGTIVAGIIGAVPNNGRGVAGINWDVRLMPVKVMDSNGVGVTSDVAAGIVWAADHGADIINLSLGGNNLENTSVLNDAIKHANDKNVLVVAAAGNDSALVGNNLDTSPVYPICSDNRQNMVLGVAAVDMNDRKAEFSNFGRNCVDISAPGVAVFNSKSDQKGILSTYWDPKQPTSNNVYVYASGTSVAAPMVSGVAALLKSLHPDLSGGALRDRLISSTDPIDALNTDDCLGGSCSGRLGSGRLNAYKALQTSTLISNSLISDPNGKIYLIENGLRHPVSDFVFHQNGYDKSAVKSLSFAEIESLPLGAPKPPQDGTLVKALDSPTVYVVANDTLLPVSYLAFKSNGFSFGGVITLPGSDVASFQQGLPLAPANGALLKLSGQQAVYFLHEGRRRLLSLFAFRSRGLKFEDVVAVDQASFDSFPEDTVTKLMPPAEGSLVKGSGAGIYVVEGGVLHSLSADAFRARGYRFPQVGIIPDSELAGYMQGDPYL